MVYLIFIIGLSRWAINDAIERDRGPLAVWVGVVLFFPCGWIAWLVFRPDIAPRAQRTASATYKPVSDVAGTPWAKDSGHR